jgi:hypothetical protein
VTASDDRTAKVWDATPVPRAGDILAAPQAGRQ